MNGGERKADRGGIVGGKARSNVTVGRDLIKRECMELRLERKEKMSVRMGKRMGKRMEIRRKMEVRRMSEMEVKNMRRKMRVMQERHPLRSPRLRYNLHRPIFSSKPHRLPPEIHLFPKTGMKTRLM